MSGEKETFFRPWKGRDSSTPLIVRRAGKEKREGKLNVSGEIALPSAPSKERLFLRPIGEIDFLLHRETAGDLCATESEGEPKGEIPSIKLQKLKFLIKNMNMLYKHRITFQCNCN